MRRLWPRTLRGRLAVLLVGIVGSLLVIGGGIQYWALRSFLLRTTAAALRDAARPSALAYGSAPPPLGTGGQAALDLVRALVSPRTAAAVIGPRGTVLATAEPAGASFPLTAAAAAVGAPPAVPQALWSPAVQVLLSGGQRYLVVATPIGGQGFGPRFPGRLSLRGGTELLLVQPMNEIDGVLRDDLLLLGIGGLIALGLGVAAARWAASGVLRPLEAVVSVADRISAGETTLRLEPSPGTVETDRLRAALDRMLRSLQQALDRERAAVVRSRGFLADASHELRTPLTAIGGLLELWQGGAGVPEGAELRGLGTAVGQAHRAQRLVDAMLSLARLDAGGERAVRACPVELRTWLDQARGDLEQIVPDHPLVINGPTGPLPAAWADPEALNLVMAALLENAGKYGGEGDPIEVALSEDGLGIAVRDHGCGIAERDLPRVFDRFYRGEAPDGRVRPGTGLGLAIVRAMVEAMGGTVEIQSRVGEGTVVRLGLRAAGAGGPNV